MAKVGLVFATMAAMIFVYSVGWAQSPTSVDNELIYRALSYDVARQVEQVMRDRQDFYWAIAGGLGAVFLTLLTFFGFGQLRDLRVSLKEQVKAELANEITGQVEQRVLAKIQSEAQNLEQRIEFFSLEILLEKIRSGEGYSDPEADTMQARIIRLSQSETFAASPEFKQKIDQVLDAYFGAGLWDRLIALDDAIRPILQSWPPLTATMLQGYMRALFGETEPEEMVRSRFLSYVEASRRLKYPERSIPYLMIYHHWTKGKNWERSIANLFADCKDLRPDERAIVLDILQRTATAEKLARAPGAAEYRIAEKAQAFNSQFAAEITKLQSSISKTS